MIKESKFRDIRLPIRSLSDQRNSPESGGPEKEKPRNRVATPEQDPDRLEKLLENHDTHPNALASDRISGTMFC